MVGRILFSVEILQNSERRLLRFWFYSEDVPEDWREGYSDRFFDLTGLTPNH